MQGSWENVAFITGASSGMGKETSFYLSSLGMDVALAARSSEEITKSAGIIAERYGTKPIALKVDVTDDGEVEAAFEEAVERYGGVGLVVNYAGNPIGYATRDRRKPIYEQTLAHMKDIAEVDHFGSVRVLKYALPYMIRQHGGMAVLISAISSVYGYSEDVDYIPYKRANEGLATSTALRSDRDGWGVQLYTLAPGDVFNPSTWDSYNEEERRGAVDYGIMESESVAKVVSWLYAGRLKRRYEMKVNLDTSEVIDEGRYVPLKNGDVVVVDAKTVPKLFAAAGESYEVFVPDGYRKK